MVIDTQCNETRWCVGDQKQDTGSAELRTRPDKSRPNLTVRRKQIHGYPMFRIEIFTANHYPFTGKQTYSRVGRSRLRIRQPAGDWLKDALDNWPALWARVSV